jgi:hypothetical protein
MESFYTQEKALWIEYVLKEKYSKQETNWKKLTEKEGRTK